MTEAEYVESVGKMNKAITSLYDSNVNQLWNVVRAQAGWESQEDSVMNDVIDESEMT